MDPNTIQQALTKVNDTNQALNGNQKLADAKQDTKTTLGTLDHLNEAQKQALTTQVEQAPDIATVNNVKQNAQNLNNAMTNLNNALQDKTETLNSINFTDADQAKKDAYTNAVANAEGILSKANGSNASQTEVEQAMQRVNAAKQALNGNDNVQRAKDAAKQVITNANDLNQAQKDALKQQVDAAQTVANVNTIKQTAQDLNQAMTQLKQGIADKDQTKANGNFVNADTDKQNAYNNAVAHAEQIISGTPNANVDPQQVAQALQQVNQAKGDLNGNHNLQVAKDNANTAIDQLPNLNQPQKTALKDQVSHAELVTGVNAIKQNADALNNAMGTLKQQIQANSQVPQSVDFTQADQDKQQAYNNAANQAQQIANGTPTPVLAPDTVTQAVTTMNQAKDALNGDEKLAQAKQDALANLDTLRDLNQPQRDALRNQINQAQALATVEQTKQNAQNVNTAMGNLKQGIANKDTVKASENYHDADVDKQTAYTNAVSQAEGIINQTTNPTLNPDDITRALTQVTDAKNSLNGEAKLATEKQNAKDAVSGMTHLNDAQKQALKGQIDQSPEIATVNQVKQTATSLDQAMDQLSQAINDKDQILADGNYLNADPDKQNAYKQAVAKAEALLNKQSITNEVNAAKQALNGNDNLANAKQQAKQQLANLTHLNDAQKQSFESQITQAPLVTDVTTINQKAQTLDHAMELLRNSVADNQTTLASEDYHDATAQRQNDYNKAVTAANNIINQTTSPTMNPDDVNGATTQVNNTKVALDGDENLAAAKQEANNRLDQLDHLNNAQKQQLQSQITQSSDIAAVNGHKQTAESLNTAMGNLINAIADHQAVEQRGNFINADTDKQTAYNTAVNEAAAMINKQTGQNANQTEVEQAITKVQTTLQALNGDHNLQVAKTNATQAIDALTSLNDPQKTALKDQVTAATLVTAVHQIEQNANTLNQAMHGLRQSIQDNAATKANSKYINEDQPEQQNYDQAVQAANNIINEQTATLDNNAINQAAATVNTTKAALHGDVKLQNDKDHAKQTVSQLAHLNNAQKHMEDTLIDSETTRTAVKQDLTEAQELDQLMDALQQSIADKDATRASSAYVNAEPNKKQAYDEAVQNAESIIAGLNNPTINKGNVSSATQAVISSKNALDGVERLAQDKQTAGNSLNHLDQLTPAQQQALENQINNATTRDKVAEIIAQAQALNEAMKALKESIKDQPQTEASSKFINEDQAQKDAYTQAVQHAKDLINKTTDPTLAKSIIDQATKLQPIAELVDQATQLNQSMDQLQQAVNEHANVEQTVDYTQADSDKQNAYKQAIADAENVLKQNANKQQVDQALQNILNAKQALNGDERVALAKTNGKHDIDQLNALNNAQQDGFKGRIDQSNDLNQIQQIVDEAKALNRAMDQLSQEITGNEGRTKGSTNYVNADTQVKQVYDEAVDKAKQALDKSTGQNLTAEQVIKLNDAITAAKKALNGEERLNNRKAEALQRLDQLTHLNNAQRQLAIQQINNAETLNKASRAINRATKLDNAMGAVQQYIDEQHLGVISSTNYINADDNLKANYDNAIANAAHELDKVQGNAIAKAEAEQLKQNIIDAQNALNGDQNLANAKDKANAFVNSLNGLNQQQQDLAHKAINNADTVSDVTDIVNNQIDLNDAMETLKHLVDNEIPNAEQTVNYQNADDNAKTNFDDAKRLANTLLNSDNTNVNDINGAIQTVNDAIHNLNGDQRLQDAKDKAIQSINQALANKLKEIEASNATDQDKHIAKNKAEELANSIINNINKATSNQAVSQVQTAGKHAIEQVHANEIPKAKIDANKDVDKQVQSLIDEIDRNPNLTDKEKQALKDRINQILQQGHNGINNAMTKEEIEQAKAQLAQALQDIKDLVKAKENAKQDIDKRVQALIDEIDQNPNLTDKEKQALKDRINQILQQGHNDINNALTKEEIEQAKAQLAQALQDIKDLVKAKEDAKNAIKALANAKRDQINSNPDLTPEQKAKALKEIDEAEKRALQNIENAQTIDQLNRGLNLGLDDIRNTHVWEVDEQPAVNEIFEATPEQILVNGELIVHRDDIITEQDILAHINLINQLSAEVIDTPSTATISDSLTAKVEVTLLDGSKVIVNVPVKVVEKELSVVKQQAIESIENAAQQKIDEINNSVTLTLEQKEAAIAEVNKLKQQAIDYINNAPDVHSVEEIQQQEQAHIEQFNPEQFTIEQAKSNAIKSIEDAIQHMIDEIKARTDLTDKEKQEAIAKLNQLKEQAIQAIQRAQSIDEISEQLEQFKAQMKAANPTAKELAKRKQEAISRIKDFSNEKINSIRNSEIGTTDEKQAAMNQINEIVLETIRDINNAHTLQQVEAALNNGIARISAVQIVISDRAKQSSSTGNESNSHLTVRLLDIKRKLMKMMTLIHFICVTLVIISVMLLKTLLVWWVSLAY